MDTPTHQLRLNRDEVMVLTDRTQNTDAGTEDMRVIAYRLLIKLGSLYLELVDPSAPAGEQREGEIRVTEAECWLLRSKVQSGDKMSSDSMFGIRLLRKLYQLLIEFDAGVDALPNAREDGATFDVVKRDALHQWAQKQEEDDNGLQHV